jgi:hypothetical protein
MFYLRLLRGPRNSASHFSPSPVCLLMNRFGSKHQARQGRQHIAGGERSEPPVETNAKRAPAGAKVLIAKGFLSPLPGLSTIKHPTLLSDSPPGQDFFLLFSQGFNQLLRDINLICFFSDLNIFFQKFYGLGHCLWAA